MSHLHIPDGVLPLWLVAAGWILTAILLALSIYRVKKIEIGRKIPLIGIIAAVMIVCMTLPIIPFAYHLNLSVVAGIILGPALAFIAIFIVDIIIAMFGHGGITVAGLNTVVVGAEAVIGYYLFQMFKYLMGSYSVGWSAALSAVFSLMISTSFLFGILYVSHINPGTIFDDHGAQNSALNFGAFIKTVLGVLFIGWLLEGAVTGLVVKYVSGIRPDLIKPTEVAGD